GDRDVPAENLRKLAVIFVEGRSLARFDIEDPNHLVVEIQRDGQAAARLIQTGDISRIALDIRADVAAAGGRDISADTMAIRLGVKLHRQRFRRQPDTNNQLELIAAPIQQPDRKVIEVHQITREADD